MPNFTAPEDARRPVSVNVEDTVVHLSSCYRDNANPVAVRKHLLCDLSAYFRHRIEHEERKGAEPLVLTLQISHRACIVVARGAYGQPMWTSRDQEDPEDYLASLAEIYGVACGQIYSWMDEFVDACVGSMEQILDQKRQPLFHPLEALEPVIEIYASDDIQPGRAGIINKLVYGDCARDGRLSNWLDAYNRGEYPDASFLGDLCLELAKSARAESAA